MMRVDTRSGQSSYTPCVSDQLQLCDSDLTKFMLRQKKKKKNPIKPHLHTTFSVLPAGSGGVTLVVIMTLIQRFRLRLRATAQLTL